MEKIHYVYLITNLVNGKQYIGDHSTNNLDDGYLGSGRPYLKNALKKYGKSNFKKEILEFFNTKEEAFNSQEKYINEYSTLAPNGYNISPIGGYGVSGSTLSEETKNKISYKLSNLPDEIRKKYGDIQRGKKRGPHSEEHKKKIGDSNRGKKWTEEQKQKYKDFYKNGMKGKNHTEESKRMISKNRRGISYGPFSEEHKNKISQSLRGENNPMKGKKFSEEERRKISEAVKKALIMKKVGNPNSRLK